METKIDLRNASFTSIAVYSKMEQTGTFECSNEAVNQLVQNSIWSQRSNFCDVPTDCPIRERAAWTGDMGVFAETGIFLEDCYPVIRKWLAECRLAQYPDGKVANIAPANNRPSYFSSLLAGSIGWGDACILVPYALYQRFGDKRILEENYEMMQEWHHFLESRAAQGRETSIPDISALSEEYQNMVNNLPKEQLEQIMKKMMTEKGRNSNGTPGTGLAQAEQNPYQPYIINTGVDYGEWCEPDVESTNAMEKPQSKVATAYFAYSGKLLFEIAEILGKPEDAKRYKTMAEHARQAFRKIATDNGRIHSDRQAEYVRAISFDLLEEEEKKQAAADLNVLVEQNNYHLNTGFLSTPSLCKVLADYGYTETAYRLLLQEFMPGWLYAVKKGATTIWENWDGIDEQGRVKASLNHYSYGAVCGWLFEGVCGIRLQRGKITIQPRPCKLLKYARAVYQSPVGEIVSGWSCQGDEVIYEIKMPPNAEVEVILPEGTSFGE